MTLIIFKRKTDMIGGKREEGENLVFAPGCALMLYNPELAEKIHQSLVDNFGEMEMLTTCCKHDPLLPSGSKIINVCPGCDKRFSNDYMNISTISLWEILDQSSFFRFPDYRNKKMSINDACPTRNKSEVQNAIRSLLVKMNINLVEPKNSGPKGTCCGDGFYGELPDEQVLEIMKERASEMPENDVVVYCVSCIKSIFKGGKKSRYLPDLLFEEKTIPKSLDLEKWHSELTDYIDTH